MESTKTEDTKLNRTDWILIAIVAISIVAYIISYAGMEESKRNKASGENETNEISTATVN